MTTKELIKSRLGYIKRGIRGYIQNKFEKTLPIPSSLQPFSIGKSVKNQEIECYQIGKGPLRLLYAFCIHGNEVGTVKLAHHFLKWAQDHANPLNHYSLYIIPCLNPDGFQQARKNPEYFKGGKKGRFNANNVDLNRNFNTPSFKQKSGWSFGKNYSEKENVYCGEQGGSEPETKALTAFIKNKKIQIVFMFHNAGKDVMANAPHLAQKLAKIYSEKTGFRLIKEGHWKNLQQTGTAAEWCDLHNIAYVEIEGSTRWGSDWKKQKKAMEATLLTHLSTPLTTVHA